MSESVPVSDAENIPSGTPIAPQQEMPASPSRIEAGPIPEKEGEELTLRGIADHLRKDPLVRKVGIVSAAVLAAGIGYEAVKGKNNPPDPKGMPSIAARENPGASGGSVQEGKDKYTVDFVPPEKAKEKLVFKGPDFRVKSLEHPDEKPPQVDQFKKTVYTENKELFPGAKEKLEKMRAAEREAAEKARKLIRSVEITVDKEKIGQGIDRAGAAIKKKEEEAKRLLERGKKWISKNIGK